MDLCVGSVEAETHGPMPEEQGTPLMTNGSWMAGYNEKGERAVLI